MRIEQNSVILTKINAKLVMILKYVLVTGAGGGMGGAAVNMLTAEGYTVFAMDLKAVPEREHVIPLVADVTDSCSLQKAVEFVRDITDTLHAVVHFAGRYILDSLIEIPENAFTNAFDVNVFGAYRVNKAFFPLLHKGSRIVITTSELAPLEPLPFTGLYAITKSTLDKYAASLRMELQLLGIAVTVLRPGAVRTEMLGVSTDQLDSFCDSTKMYSCNANRFRKIVDSVEAANVPAETVAKKLCRIIHAKHVLPVYNINRNPLLLLLNMLPKSVQGWAIRKILK